MTTAIQCFDFKEHPVRVLDREGAPWFVAADVCRVLETGNPTEALRSLDSDEKITLSNPEGNPRAGIPHSTNIINESGLYALIFKSRKPQAKSFRKWVTSEVLPAIRKTGSYTAPAAEEPEPLPSAPMPELEAPEPRGLAAIQNPVTIPTFLAWRESVRAWGVSEHIRFGRQVHLLAKAWGVPWAFLATAEFGQLRAIPAALAEYVLRQMEATPALAGSSSLGRDYAVLLGALERKFGTKEFSISCILKVATEEGLFDELLQRGGRSWAEARIVMGAAIRKLARTQSVGGVRLVKRRARDGSRYSLQRIVSREKEAA